MLLTITASLFYYSNTTESIQLIEESAAVDDWDCFFSQRSAAAIVASMDGGRRSSSFVSQKYEIKKIFKIFKMKNFIKMLKKNVEKLLKIIFNKIKN